MAAAPQLAPHRTSPLSPRRASEAPACNSLRWQQPPRQSPGAETRSRTVPDLPDPDLAAATEASATVPPSTNPATPAIKFPEPNLSSVGTLGTTTQNPMIASAPTLLCDPCTPTSDVATAPLWDPVSTVCAPSAQLSNSQVGRLVGKPLAARMLFAFRTFCRVLQVLVAAPSASRCRKA